MVESDSLLIKVSPKDIIFFDKIIESIDNLAIITVINGKTGLLGIQVTRSQKNELFKVLDNIGREYKIV